MTGEGKAWSMFQVTKEIEVMWDKGEQGYPATWTHWSLRPALHMRPLAGEQDI